MEGSGFHFKHALLIDDSEIDILVNRRLMELTNFAAQVTILNSGEEALEFFKYECTSPEKAPDFIFLDLHLPMMSGHDFIEEFKKLPDYITSKSKIIVLSVFQKQEQLQQLSAYDFIAGQLEKPLTRHSLQSLIANGVITINASAGKTL